MYISGLSGVTELQAMSNADLSDQLYQFLLQEFKLGAFTYQRLTYDVRSVMGREVSWEPKESPWNRAQRETKGKRVRVRDKRAAKDGHLISSDMLKEWDMLSDILQNPEYVEWFVSLFHLPLRGTVDLQPRQLLRSFVRTAARIFMDNELLGPGSRLRLLDGPGIVELLDKEQYRRLFPNTTWCSLRTLIHEGCMRPDIDVDGSYRSWAQNVCRSVMKTFDPIAQKFSRCVLWRLVEYFDHHCACRILKIMVDVVLSRVSSSEVKLVDRIYASVSHEAVSVIDSWHGITRTANENILRYIGEEAQLTDLQALAARMVGYHNRRAGTAVRRGVRPGREGRPRAELILCALNSWILAGAFPGIPTTERLRMRALVHEVFMLETQCPGLYAIQPGPRRLISHSVIDESVIQSFLAVAKNKREIAYIKLSAYSGLRAGAIQNAKLNDFWDPISQTIRPIATVLEKNSKHRELRMQSTRQAREASAALAEFILQEHKFSSPFLFHHPRRPHIPWKNFCLVIMQMFCVRLGKPTNTYHHHQFRKYVANHYMKKNGARLEHVQRFLGHASANTTFVHYWTDHVDLMETSEATENVLEKLQHRVQELEQENNALKASVKAMADQVTDDEDTTTDVGTAAPVASSDHVSTEDMWADV